MNQKQITTKVAEMEIVNNVKAIANDVVVVNKVNTNVVDKVVNPITMLKSTFNGLLKLTERSVDQRFKLLQQLAYSEASKNYFAAIGLKKEEFNKVNVFACFSKVVTKSEAETIVNYYRIVKISESVKALTFEGDAPEINISILEKKYLISTEGNKITLLMDGEFFTFAEIESLSFHVILTKIVQFKKMTKLISERDKKAASDLLKTPKTPKTPKVNFATMTNEEFTAWKLTQAV